MGVLLFDQLHGVWGNMKTGCWQARNGTNTVHTLLHTWVRKLLLSLLLWTECPSKFMCWNFNPQDLRMLLYLETGPLKRKLH